MQPSRRNRATSYLSAGPLPTRPSSGKGQEIPPGSGPTGLPADLLWDLASSSPFLGHSELRFP